MRASTTLSGSRRRRWRNAATAASALAIVAVMGACGGGNRPAGGQPPVATEHADRVASVTDGDTVVLERLGPSRLIGIDTPEVHPERECFGPEAVVFTERLLSVGTRVRYRFDAEHDDRYGRALIYLWVDGRFVNGELVRGGYATPLRVPPNTRFAPRFERLARGAREAGRGLWTACSEAR